MKYAILVFTNKTNPEMNIAIETEGTDAEAMMENAFDILNDVIDDEVENYELTEECEWTKENYTKFKKMHILV